MVTITPGSNQFNLLPGLGGGLFGNPTAFDTAETPVAIAAADFGGNGAGFADVAVLERDEVQIFDNDGRGGFVEAPGSPISIPTGFDPTSMTVSYLGAGGIADLILSNSYGDVLLLIGDGSASFSTPTYADRYMGLAVTPGGQTVAVSDQSTDRVTIEQAGLTVVTTLADITDSLRSPGTPVFADLTGDGYEDLIVADGGADDVRVYLGQANGSYVAPVDFAVGTNPVGVTVAYLNGNDSLPDLIVSNEGSDDVSILLGERTDAGWTLVPGPRLKVGAGPTATSVLDFVAGAPPDLVVSESLAGDVRILPGIGNGYFNDLDPTIVPTGEFPGAPITLTFSNGAGTTTGVAVPNAGSDSLTLISGGESGFEVSNVPSEGIEPVAIVAVELNPSQTDLLVANEVDGHFGILSVNEDGTLSVAGFFTDPRLPHPASLEIDRGGYDEPTVLATETSQASPVSLGMPLQLTSVAVPSAVSASPPTPDDLANYTGDSTRVAPSPASSSAANADPPGVVALNWQGYASQPGDPQSARRRWWGGGAAPAVATKPAKPNGFGC